MFVPAVEQAKPAPITVVLNWPALLKKQGTVTGDGGSRIHIDANRGAWAGRIAAIENRRGAGELRSPQYGSRNQEGTGAPVHKSAWHRHPGRDRHGQDGRSTLSHTHRLWGYLQII
jgi:hypothetical protein